MTDNPPALRVVEITTPEGTALHGPYRPDVAERIADGARKTGATAAARTLRGDIGDAVTALLSSWPPRGYELHETASIYVDPAERYVVSLIVGYGEDDEVGGPRDAAYHAVDLTRDQGCDGTRIFVFDRHTGQMHSFEQGDIDTGLFDDAIREHGGHQEAGA